ncbi:hypothetical protein Hanom_Chr16g01511391 [Helianthus anomalus]
MMDSASSNYQVYEDDHVNRNKLSTDAVNDLKTVKVCFNTRKLGNSHQNLQPNENGGKISYHFSTKILLVANTSQIFKIIIIYIIRS